MWDINLKPLLAGCSRNTTKRPLQHTVGKPKL